MIVTREAFAATLRGSAAALSYPGSVLPASFGISLRHNAAVLGSFDGRMLNKQPEWTGSAPSSPRDAQRGKRPGAEVGHPICDADHINFIIAGRNVG